MKHLFIVTYGKSGSTLLMGLLNSIPGFQIMGENGGVILNLLQYQKKASEVSRKWTTSEPLESSHPWYGIDHYPSDVALDRMADLVTDTLLRPGPDTIVTGFKEIRWWTVSVTAYLDFLDSLYPNARYLLNTRNHQNVAASSWWKKDPDAVQTLERIEANMRRAVGSRGERGYHIHYDDYIADRTLLRELCDWLEVDYDQERFDRVMDIRHTTKRRS
ncbi:MAG: sulfotransferase [Ornithinimicrobium sp.]